MYRGHLVPALASFISPKKAACLWRCTCCLKSFWSSDSFQIGVVDPVETRCKILFRILTWLLSWLNLKPPTKKSYNKIYEIGFQRGKKRWIRGRKKRCQPQKLLGLPGKTWHSTSWQLNYRRNCMERRCCSQNTSRDSAKAGWHALHCGNKEPFGTAIHSGRCGMSCREETAVPGLLRVCVLSTLGYVLTFGPALSETTEENWSLRPCNHSLTHSLSRSVMCCWIFARRCTAIM